MPDVIMDYEMMHQMRSAFEKASSELDEILTGLNMIRSLTDDGALVGRGAQQFLDLLENGIIPYTKQIQAKMDELAQDVEGARAFLEDGDETAASRFK